MIYFSVRGWGRGCEKNSESCKIFKSMLAMLSLWIKILWFLTRPRITMMMMITAPWNQIHSTLTTCGFESLSPLFFRYTSLITVLKMYVGFFKFIKILCNWILIYAYYQDRVIQNMYIIPFHRHLLNFITPKYRSKPFDIWRVNIKGKNVYPNG